MEPAALRFGFMTFYWYGVTVALAALLAALVARGQARFYGEEPAHVWDLFPWVVVLGIVGARIGHVVSQPAAGLAGWTYYREHLPEVVAFWAGGWRGLDVFGAILGGVLAVGLYAWRHRRPLLRWLDIVAPPALLAQAVGRVGNYLNQELYGPPTSLPWGVKIDAAHRYGPYRDLIAYPVESTRFHPTFFYEAAWNALGFAVLLWVSRRFRDRLRPGDVALLYGIWYPAGRFWLETLRPDAWTLGAGPLTVGQVVSLGALAISALLLGWRRLRR